MSDLISREETLRAIDSLGEDCISYYNLLMLISRLPSAEPETITIEEVSNQLGCATIQSALYWFEFLKTLDLLGFAIIRKETK